MIFKTIFSLEFLSLGGRGEDRSSPLPLKMLRAFSVWNRTFFCLLKPKVNDESLCVRHCESNGYAGVSLLADIKIIKGSIYCVIKRSLRHLPAEKANLILDENDYCHHYMQ